jgi:histidinol-phosphate aminotransferase
MTEELPFRALLRPELAELSAYAPVEGTFRVRLDANEAPARLSDTAREKLARAAAGTDWERYPDPRAKELRAAIAKHQGVSAEEVLAGVGSDEVISWLVTAFSERRPNTRAPSLITTTPTFVMYRMSAKVRGWSVLEVPLDAGWQLSQPSLLRAIELSPPNLVFIASPNNPTGTRTQAHELHTIIEAAKDSLVVIDEAYVDYADGDCSELRSYPNVALLRTLSKIGFASLRVGWIVAHPALVRELDKVRLPYNLPTLSQRLATLVLSELGDELERLANELRTERERVHALLSGLPRVAPTPSQANFIWFRTERPAEEVFGGLVERGILVRSFHTRGGRVAHQLRVTLGTREENDAFLAALGEVT